ncbi:Vir protein [Legionella pneumophila]|uniref:Vir protein n=1 Tax=Legionella pneumophila TaxID=446 RepID=UPI0022B3C70F|nr:Vir protein [Legionella pneumophila]MCZ4806709.1 Vir protein [Legionella pneumophila]
MKTNTSSQTSSTCNATDSRKKCIENLFTRFAVFYGHLWRSQFKSDGFLEFAKKEWLKGLSQFSDEILNQVIIDCRDHCEMPPTLPQLIGFCRDIKKRNTFYVRPEKYQPASKEVVEENIRQCKAYLFK